LGQNKRHPASWGVEGVGVGLQCGIGDTCTHGDRPPPPDGGPAIHHDEPMVSRMDARLTGDRQRQNLADCDVANIVGLRKLRQR